MNDSYVGDGETLPTTLAEAVDLLDGFVMLDDDEPDRPDIAEAFGLLYKAAKRPSIADQLKAHTPSITDEVESELNDRLINVVMDRSDTAMGLDGTVADLALRRCHCGVMVDGFYEYVDHLKEVLR